MRIVHEHKQLLRLFWEAKLHSAKFCSPVSPNSTTRMRGRVQLHRHKNRTQKNQHTSLKLVCCSFFYLIEPLSVPYERLYDERLGLLLTMRKYFPLPLNRRILRPRYVEYPHRQLYYGSQFVR